MCPEYIVPLFERLSRRHDIEFVFSRFGQTQAFFFDPERLSGVRYQALRPPPWPLLPFRSRVLNKLSVWTHLTFLAVQLAHTLHRGRYDLVIGGDFQRFECVVAFLVARSLGRRFGLWSDAWHWPVIARDRLWRPVVRRMVQSADVLIAGGTKAKEKLEELGAGETPIVNVYHTNVAVKPLRTPPPPGAERFVLYVGRLEARKGVEYLIRAFAQVRGRHPAVRLKILGRGERAEGLEAVVRTLGIQDSVDFVGWVDHARIDEYYAACAAFVLPSVFTADGGYEPFSNVVLEAMACGTPTIATTANGAAFDVLDHGINGLVVPDRDVDALAAALDGILADPDKAEAMGRRGRETVRDRFNVDRMAERFSEAITYMERQH